jgi:NAD(P)-dependent dehydrogenase (short-subunit alcohol dehydrogenase family)
MHGPEREGGMSERVLEGKVAIVTGGSRGIGLAIARSFAQSGASVALAARNADDLDRATKDIEAQGRRAIGLPTDVTDEAQVQSMVDRTVERFGTVDILVNNAGAAPFFAPIDQMRTSGFEKYFRVNFTSAVLCTKAVAPVLLEKGEGCAVLNVASVAGLMASPGLTYYAGAKAALINFTRTVAREWAPRRVRVNAVAPGWIETDLNEPARTSLPGFEQGVLDSIPLGRWGTPEDVAGAAVYLCSRGASFVTGAVLVVDGGQTLSTIAGP